MSQFGTNERRVLLALKSLESPSPEDEARVEKQLDAELLLLAGGATSGALLASSATGPALSGSLGASGSLASSGFTTSLLAKVLLGVALAGGATAGAVIAFSNVPEKNAAEKTAEKSALPPVDGTKSMGAPAFAPTPAKEQLSETPPRTPLTVAPSLTKAAEERKSAPAGVKNSDTSESIDGEISLIAEAQRALGRGDANTALLLLEKHRERYPSGALGTERKALSAVALCLAGRTTEGKQLGAKFLESFPTSPLAARVRRGCGLPAPESAP